MDETDHIVFLVGGIILGSLQAYNTYKQRETNKTVNEVHTLVNGSMTQQKKLYSEVTAWKAVSSGKPEDFKIADEAMKDYVASLATQASVVEQEKPKTP
jgi:hypothetical protein